MTIVTVNEERLEAVLPLIGAYQEFYRMRPDRERNREFFGRLAGKSPLGEMYAALDDEGRVLGFATVYFLPSSLTARTYCLLNDLYVLPESRGKGVGRALLRHAGNKAHERGFQAMDWQTEASNLTAQRLYDDLPADKSAWFYYSLKLPC